MCYRNSQFAVDPICLGMQHPKVLLVFLLAHLSRGKIGRKIYQGNKNIKQQEGEITWVPTFAFLSCCCRIGWRDCPGSIGGDWGDCASVRGRREACCPLLQVNHPTTFKVSKWTKGIQEQVQTSTVASGEAFQSCAFSVTTRRHQSTPLDGTRTGKSFTGKRQGPIIHHTHTHTSSVQR